MRLKHVYISEYKNLKDFSLDFDGDSFLDVFVGKNGSGKSNFFEALILIFKHLYEGTKEDGIDFNYKIHYDILDDSVKISWNEKLLTVNGKEQKSLGKIRLPDDFLIYYSGHNDTVSSVVKKHALAFQKFILKANLTDSQKFISIDSKHKQILLLMILIQKKNNQAKKFICEKLGIKNIATEFKVILDRPYYADKNYKIDMGDYDSFFWSAKGITRYFLGRLRTCQTPGSWLTDYNPKKDQYLLHLSIKSVQKEFRKEAADGLFRLFDNLKTLGMLSSILLEVELENGIKTGINHFSDGQFQLVYIYALMELSKDRNCITLLDEPDSFLHPEWQFEFLKQIDEISETATKNNHILMSSHSAATLAMMKAPNVRSFNMIGKCIQSNKIEKREAIKKLSNGLIALSENETIMTIGSFLKYTDGPVLFTEGLSDEIILSTAWGKLYSKEHCPFCIHGAFDRSFLRNMFSRDELRNNYPDRPFFALFDIDEAFNDWNALKEERHEITDPFKGLVKKLKNVNHYALLLPVPNSDIKKQVLDKNDKIWEKDSVPSLPIELLFFNNTLLPKWYEETETAGGGRIIRFTGDKVNFAQEVVPSVDAKNFEVFRPMFEFIKGKCASSITGKTARPTTKITTRIKK